MELKIKLRPLIRGQYDPRETIFIPKQKYSVDPNQTIKEFVVQLFHHPDIRYYISHLHDENAITAHFPKTGLYCNRGADDVLSHPLYTLLKVESLMNDSKYSDLLLVYPKKDSRNELKTINCQDSDSLLTLDKSACSECKPIIFLDVDGVINITGNSSWEDVKTYKIHGMNGSRNVSITCSQKMVEKINTWSKKSEIRWLTSWSYQAKYRLAPLIGLFDFKVCPFWKTDLVKSLTDRDKARPIVWIDDDLKDYLIHELRNLQSSVRDSLSVIPTGGLSPALAEEVDKFLSEHGD